MAETARHHRRDLDRPGGGRRHRRGDHPRLRGEAPAVAPGRRGVQPRQRQAGHPLGQEGQGAGDPAAAGRQPGDPGVRRQRAAGGLPGALPRQLRPAAGLAPPGRPGLPGAHDRRGLQPVLQQVRPRRLREPPRPLPGRGADRPDGPRRRLEPGRGQRLRAAQLRPAGGVVDAAGRADRRLPRLPGGPPELLNSRLDYAELLDQAKQGEDAIVFTELRTYTPVGQNKAIVDIGSKAQPFKLFLPDVEGDEGQRLLRLLDGRYLPRTTTTSAAATPMSAAACSCSATSPRWWSPRPPRSPTPPRADPPPARPLHPGGDDRSPGRGEEPAATAMGVTACRTTPR